jgi:hypothetical protein
MLVEIFRVRIANQYGDIVTNKRVEWTDYDTPNMTFTVSEVMSNLWLIMPKLDQYDWDLVKVGGNHRFRKLWLASLDGRYVMYVSAKKERV